MHEKEQVSARLGSFPGAKRRAMEACSSSSWGFADVKILLQEASTRLLLLGPRSRVRTMAVDGTVNRIQINSSVFGRGNSGAMD